MIVVDTSIWIEFFRAKDPVFQALSKLMESGQVIALPWVFGELLQGAKDSREVGVLKETWTVLHKPELVLSEHAWIKAGVLSQQARWIQKGVGLIDAAIIAVAQELDAPVWTLDKKLADILRFKRLLYLVDR